MPDLSDTIYPADPDEALALYAAWLRQAGKNLAAGNTHLARQDLLATVAGFIMWLLPHFEPQEHDELISGALLTIAEAFLEGRTGRLHPIFVPDDPDRHGARRMSVAEIRYRAFVGLASQTRHCTDEGVREGVGACDQSIATAVTWVDDDPVLAERLGGSLTKNSVRNARLDIENNRGPIAAYAQGIPVPEGTVEERAKWLRVQVDHREGAAYGT